MCLAESLQSRKGSSHGRMFASDRNVFWWKPANLRPPAVFLPSRVDCCHQTAAAPQEPFNRTRVRGWTTCLCSSSFSAFVHFGGLVHSDVGLLRTMRGRTSSLTSRAALLEQIVGCQSTHKENCGNVFCSRHFRQTLDIFFKVAKLLCCPSQAQPSRVTG